MIKRLLMLTISCLLMTSPLFAETVSCIDSDGVRHLADDMMSLPESCRNQFKVHPEQESGSVSYVPTESPGGPVSEGFEKAVREEEQAQLQKKQRAALFVDRAAALANAYLEAVANRKSAIRSQQYGNRQSIQAADEMMQRSRTEKQLLLIDLDRAQLSSEQRQAVQAHLDKIE